MPATLIVAASALLSFTAAAPVQGGMGSGSLKARQAPSCNIGIQASVNAPYASSCWDTLGIMPYLTNWKAATPTCTDAESSAGQTLGCCGASEPWSTCFLRLATKQSNAYDCTQLAPTACSFPARLDPALDPTIASQVNYVVLNIMMINNFFAGYYTALQKALPGVGASLKSSQMDLDVGVNTQNLMAALTLGLPFAKFTNPKSIFTPVRTTSDDGTTTTYTISRKRNPLDPNGSIPTIFAQQSSTSSSTSTSSTSTSSSSASGWCASEYSWVSAYFQNGHHRRDEPNCTYEEEAATVAAGVDPNASGIAPLAADSAPVIIFNQALSQSANVASAMWPSPPNDATNTLADFAGGQFDSNAALTPILNAGLQLIMSDVATFIAFATNGIFSTPLTAEDLPNFYGQGLMGALGTFILSQVLASKSMSATPCSSGNQCHSFYQSPVTQRQYSFDSNTYQVMNQAQDSLDVDLPTLFDGAYNCTFAGLAGGSVVSVQANGPLNVACLSALPMYIQGDCPEGATFVGGKCPFGHV